MSHSVYFHGFWGGFFEKTNPVHVGFFERLLSTVYSTSIKIVEDIESATILVENTQATSSIRTKKEWMHTYLFSGESYIRDDWREYTCVLYGQRCHDNIVNLPLYIPYIYCSGFESLFENKRSVQNCNSVPSKDVFVCISNSGGSFRNKFLEQLEKHMKVDYWGTYKNNMGGPLAFPYNSPEFLKIAGDYKFVIAMENSEEETYITEKILHGLLANTIPVYWGSKHVTDYFNKDRILEVRDHADIDTIIAKMKGITNWGIQQMLESPIFTDTGARYTIDQIAKQIRNILFPSKYSGLLTHIAVICDPKFEPVRYKQICEMCETHEFPLDRMVSFISPTYKPTVTDEMVKKYIKKDLCVPTRSFKLRRAELSLTLNFRAVFTYLDAIYRDGMFLTLESDVHAVEGIKNFADILQSLKTKQDKWSCIHFGGNPTTYDALTLKLPYLTVRTPYREYPTNVDDILKQEIEDISTASDKVRFVRYYSTRCTDSMVWTKQGIHKMAHHIATDENYGAPFDYYMINLIETNMDFKYYLSTEPCFFQGSISGNTYTTIQSDAPIDLEHEYTFLYETR